MASVHNIKAVSKLANSLFPQKGISETILQEMLEKWNPSTPRGVVGSVKREMFKKISELNLLKLHKINNYLIFLFNNVVTFQHIKKDAES